MLSAGSTGIISAGFVEQHSRLKRISEQGNEHDIHFIKIRMRQRDKWVGRTISEIDPPYGMIVAAIRRNNEVIIPKGDQMQRSSAFKEKTAAVPKGLRRFWRPRRDSNARPFA